MKKKEMWLFIIIKGTFLCRLMGKQDTLLQRFYGISGFFYHEFFREWNSKMRISFVVITTLFWIMFASEPSRAIIFKF